MSGKATYLLMILCLVLFVSARGDVSTDLFFYTLNLEEASAPHVFGDHIIFSYQSEYPVRAVAISFAHETYTRLHLYRRVPDTQNLFYYAYPLRDAVENLQYRLVVDSVWGADPFNPRSRVEADDIEVSLFDLPSFVERPAVTTVQDQGLQFVLDLSRSGGEVRITHGLAVLPREPARGAYVVGNFSNWDPFFHRLHKDGDRYTLTLDLPPGTYYYYFIVDGTRILDPGNPTVVREAYRKHFVSVIEVPRAHTVSR